MHAMPDKEKYHYDCLVAVAQVVLFDNIAQLSGITARSHHVERQCHQHRNWIVRSDRSVAKDVAHAHRLALVRAVCL